jgi:hypothetical protein
VKKRYLIIVGVVIVLVGTFIWKTYARRNSQDSVQNTPTVATATAADSANEQAVRDVVVRFGDKLKMVPLLAPKAVVIKAIQDNYAALVSSDILATWEKDPAQALGRRTSSPWPDRITISSITLNSDGSYDLSGKVIEVAGSDLKNTAASYDIAFKVRKVEGRWLITGTQAIIPR